MQCGYSTNSAGRFSLGVVLILLSASKNAQNQQTQLLSEDEQTVIKKQLTIQSWRSLFTCALLKKTGAHVQDRLWQQELNDNQLVGRNQQGKKNDNEAVEKKEYS